MINYRLKSVNQDFLVREVSFFPQLTDKRNSSYSYVLLKKEGLTTFDIIDIIKDYFKLSLVDVSAEGLKDEDGVTEQLISIKHILNETDLKNFNSYLCKINKKAQILIISGYGNDPAQPGTLHGNTFEISVRNLTETQANKVLLWCQNNKYFSFINYYDSQRFGTPESIHNTHLIGKAIVNNNWKRAYSEFVKSGGANQITINPNAAKMDNTQYQKLMTENINPQKISFFISSYNSCRWNKKVSDTLSKCEGSFFFNFDIIGKLVIFNKNGFTCPNSVSVSAYEYDKESGLVKKKIKTRSLIVTTTIIASKTSGDELNKGKFKIILSFFLPMGSYATMAIKQLFCAIFNT